MDHIPHPAPTPPMRLRPALLASTLLLLAALVPFPARAQTALAPTPPMGWNSWDSFGLTVTEQQFRDNTAVLARDLKPLGWRLAVIDEGWFLQDPLHHPTTGFAVDANGRYIPVPTRFPSALSGSQTPGFAALGAWVHAQGLQFGIHILRGIPRESTARNLPIAGSAFHAQDAADTTDACPWNSNNWGVRDNPAGQAWYDALLQQYAAWGVDFLKVDCIADRPYKPSEIRQIHRAIQRSGRPIVLSLSPGPTALSHAAEVASLAQMWRISNDVWDVWTSPDAAPDAFPQTVRGQFSKLAAWAPFAKPGNWPDADMLPLGRLAPHPDYGPGPRHTQLTPAEQPTMLTLWSIARSPLILGANLTELDAATRALLTNPDVLAINQTATGSHQLLHQGNLVVWQAMLPRGQQALALFNLGDAPLTLNRPLSSLAPGDWRVTDLWRHTPATSRTELTDTLPAHGCLLLRLTPSPVAP